MTGPHLLAAVAVGPEYDGQIGHRCFDHGGVATELIGFLRSECNKSACTGIRFRCLEPDLWADRLTREATERTDESLFLPAGVSVAEMAKAVGAHPISVAAAIDQLCR